MLKDKNYYTRQMFHGVILKKRGTFFETQCTSSWKLYPVYTRKLHTAYVKQTYSKYTCTTCALSLLHVCFLV